MTRFGTLVGRVNERGHGVDLPLMSVSQTLGVVRRSELTNDPPRADSLDQYKICRAGDIVFNKMSIRDGAMGVAPEDGLVTYHYEVMRPLPGADPRYVVYLMKSEWFTGELIKSERGIGAGGTSGVRTTEVPFSVLRTIDAPIASPVAQRAIADYLDAETARIDDLERAIRKQIDLLKEQRQRTAMLALFDGIYKRDARARPGPDAGVSRRWPRVALRRLATMRAGEAIDSTAIQDSGPYPVFGGNGLRGYANSFTHSGDYVLVGRQGALCGNVNYASGNFWATEHAIVVKPARGVEVRWLGEILRALDLNRLSQSAAQPGLSVGVILAQVVPLPPFTEQRDVASFLDERQRRLEVVVGGREKQIALLIERRQALITAAVAGQLAIPGVAA